MTNHSETTGSSDNSGTSGPEDINRTVYESGGAQQVTLRSPAELADALPYLLGYRPEDSIVLVALHDKDGRGRFGGRARLGIPASAEDWPSAARQLAHGLVTGSERRGSRPEQMVVFLCHEPGPGESGRQVKERLGPLAHVLRLECGALDIPVVEALCVSDGRFWSYCCDDDGCCPAEGTPLGLPGTSVLAAATAYAGLRVRGSLRELRDRLLPRESTTALEQEKALDTAGLTLVPRILDAASRQAVAEEALGLAARIMDRFADAPPASDTVTEDLRDDELLGHDEAATLILGLQDRTTRDRAAAWMEGDEAGPALRLWRALARRCAGPYGEHAAAPLTLAGWVAWSTGDELEAREALALALAADPDYLFARLLHQACNEGLDPESVRRCLRTERVDRGRAAPDERAMGAEPREEAEGGASAAEPAAPGPAASALPPLPRRQRTRGPGGGKGAYRRTCAQEGRPGGRLPYPRASSKRARPGDGAAGGGDRRGTRPGGARTGGARPGPVSPGTAGPGAEERRGVPPRGGAQAGRQDTGGAR
ncbi:DUF4192 family protein [Streptomyces sp. NPDC093250]|uniref:DUF4192 domain-containing protein n=1 Tax=Streptomyces sp. NPDC093250 TaxID=3366036 RepID=UPI003828FA83